MREQTFSPNERLESLKRAAHLMYGSVFVGGAPALATFFTSFSNVRKAEGTWLESHFKWHIRTILYGIIGFILLFVPKPSLFPLMDVLIYLVWLVYRHARGWNRLNNGESMPGAMIHLSRSVKRSLSLIFVVGLLGVLFIKVLPEGTRSDYLKPLVVFDLDLNFATRKEVREALEGKGMKLLKEDLEGEIQTYDSSKVMSGSSTLEMRYLKGNEFFSISNSENEPFVEMTYFFPERKDRVIFEKTLENLERKYGKAQVIKKVNDPKSWRYIPLSCRWENSFGGADIELSMVYNQSIHPPKQKNAFRLTYRMSRKIQEVQKQSLWREYKDVWDMF